MWMALPWIRTPTKILKYFVVYNFDYHRLSLLLSVDSHLHGCQCSLWLLWTIFDWWLGQRILFAIFGLILQMSEHCHDMDDQKSTWCYCSLCLHWSATKSFENFPNFFFCSEWVLWKFATLTYSFASSSSSGFCDWNEPGTDHSVCPGVMSEELELNLHQNLLSNHAVQQPESIVGTDLRRTRRWKEGGERICRDKTNKVITFSFHYFFVFVTAHAIGWFLIEIIYPLGRSPGKHPDFQISPILIY